MAETVECWWLAKRADDIAAALTRIRTSPLPSHSHADITNVISEVLHSGSLLRDLSDLLRIYRDRVSLVRGFLGILAPCLGRSVEDIRYLLGEKGSFRQVWGGVVERMGEDGGGSLYTRFIMYNGYMVQLVRLLSRPSMYEATVLKTLIEKTLRLRAARGIEAPRTLPLLPLWSQVRIPQTGQIHWAQQIFDRKHAMTRMRHQVVSCCYAPSMPDAALETPPGSTVLFKLKFNQNTLSVVLYLPPYPPTAARLLCRWTARDGSPAYASRGLHELRIKRKGCALKLERWSLERGKPEEWLVLYFKGWEKMVLFHDVFAVLKQHCPRTVMCDPEELMLGEERKLFRGRITTASTPHILTLYLDKTTSTPRLSATIPHGPLKRSPVWTAFVHPDSLKPENFRRRARKVLLKKLDMNVYDQGYEGRRRGRGGEMVLGFCEDGDAEAFLSAWKALAKEAAL
ncbi:hypothetical protein VC83_00940 [Pseudogymnoascus destructans]|uniref:Uncharacterized protein n=1 Tax=Pseudogymnoascus destructans TaxID=655981 RepID=A0A177AKI6_9PEZI|nr:uncharacterized protein VC83_00940 [Pseudogymnoascus destructans]OAF62545.1 hypothetical protein VC83_00940 [Pseudogymnoascus destructans]